MTTIAGHDLRERVDGTVTVTVSVEQTGLLGRVVGVLFGGRTGRCLDVEAIGLKRRQRTAVGPGGSPIRRPSRSQRRGFMLW